MKQEKEFIVDDKKIKELVMEFTKIFKTFFTDTTDRNEIRDQMILTLAALSMAARVVQEEAAQQGFDIRIEVFKLPEPSSELQ